MQVARWGNSLAVRIPAAVVEALELKEGDEIEIHIADARELAVARKPGRDEFLKLLRAFRGRLPVDFKFDRMRPMPGSFFDTNVLLYIAAAEAAKADRAEAIIGDGGVISVRVLNEVADVARRKMRMTWPDTHAFLSTLRSLLTVQPMTVETHETGLAFAERYNLSTHDAMIAASALHADCDTLWTEDMQHNMLLGDRLRIVNPFRVAG